MSLSRNYQEMNYMATLDRQTVEKLSQLCRIGCSEAEIDALLIDLQKIVSYIDLLNEVDTADVEPCNQVLSYPATVEREDCIGEPLKREVLLKNAPDQAGGLFKVPKVIHKED